VVGGGFVNDPAGFITSFGNLIRTNLAPAQLMPYVDTASRIDRDHIYRDVVTYPLIKYVAGDPRGWIVVAVVDKIRALGALAFPPAGTLPSTAGTSLTTIPPDDGTPRRSGPTTCTAAPTPAPSLTPAASGGPSGEPSPAPTDEATPEPTAPPTPGPTPAPTDTPGP